MANKKLAVNLLGVKLKQAREARGLTIETAAIRLADKGISTKMIEAWELGFDIPNDDKLNAMAEVYKVNANDFILIKNDVEYASKANNNHLYRKYVGKTFWDIFGGFIMAMVKLAIAVLIVFYIIKSGTIDKIKNYFDDDDKTSEDYVITDEDRENLHNQNKDPNFYQKNKKIEEEKFKSK